MSGYTFGFQHFKHFVGGGGGSALLEIAGNYKDGVPSAYLGDAIRAAGRAVFLLNVINLSKTYYYVYNK